MLKKIQNFIEEANLSEAFELIAKCEFNNRPILASLKGEFLSENRSWDYYARLNCFVRDNYIGIKSCPQSVEVVERESKTPESHYDFLKEYNKLLTEYRQFQWEEKGIETELNYFNRIKSNYEDLSQYVKKIERLYKELKLNLSFNVIKPLTWETSSELSRVISEYKNYYNSLRTDAINALNDPDLIEFIQTLMETPSSLDTIQVLKNFVKHLQNNHMDCFNSWKNIREVKKELLDFLPESSDRQKFKDYFEKIDSLYVVFSQKKIGGDYLFLTELNKVSDYLKFLKEFSSKF